MKWKQSRGIKNVGRPVFMYVHNNKIRKWNKLPSDK